MERRPELGVKGRIALAFAVLLARGSMEFANGGARPIYAESPTPSPTRVTTTPTPDALTTRIADARTTETALDKEKKDKDELARIQERISVLQGTPTRTPTPDPDVVTLRRKDLDTLIQNGVEAELSMRARQSVTLTPRARQPEIIPTPEKTGVESNQRGGDFPWWVIFGIPVAFGGGLGWGRRQQIIDRIRQGINRVRNRFGGGEAVGGGAAGTPGAGGPPAGP